MEPLLAAVTYTKDGHKKRKNQKWLDGMLRYNPETHAGVLLTEDGQSICQGKVPKEFLPGGEEFPLEQHILVSIDEWRTGAPPGATPAPPQAASLLHSLTTATASRPAQRSKTFAVPQPMPLARQAPNPAQYSSNCGEVPLSNSMRHRNLGAVRPCDPMPTLAQPVQRSTDEILELLGICVPLSMRAIAGDTADPAGHPEATCPAAAPSMPEAGSSAPGAPGSSKWGGTSQQGLTTSAPSLEGRSKDTPASSEIPKQHPCTEVRRIGNGPPSGHGMQWRAPAAPGQLSRAPMSLHAAPSHVGSVPVGLTNSRAQPAPPAKRIPGSIYFPGPQDKVLRGVAVPERFNSGASYQQSWEAALCEEITLRIADCAKNFHAACGATNGPRGAAAAGRDGSALETALRKARVPYYGSCELFIWQNYPARKGGAPAGGHKKRKKGQGSDDEEDGEEPTKPENVYLILKSGRQKSAEYHKGDMWIISNVPLLQSGLDAGVPGDRNRAPWTAVVCSLWHGPNQDGK